MSYGNPPVPRPMSPLGQLPPPTQGLRRAVLAVQSGTEKKDRDSVLLKSKDFRAEKGPERSKHTPLFAVLSLYRRNNRLCSAHSPEYPLQRPIPCLLHSPKSLFHFFHLLRLISQTEDSLQNKGVRKPVLSLCSSQCLPTLTTGSCSQGM